MDEAANERRLILEAGSVVILHPDGPAGGFPLVIPVDQVADGLHWFLGCIDPIRRGDTLMVESPVQDDARYVTRARVEASSQSAFALRIEPVWQRVQQRAFVRISAHGLQVRVVRSKPSAETAAPVGSDAGTEAASPSSGEVYELLDISAGGIRFRSHDDFETDEEVVCHFELPGSACFVLPARVVRGSTPPPPGGRRRGVGVEFVGLDEQHRSELLRWVYREQVRRHRAGTRAAREHAARDRS
jgi:c-di-GMP-binding flagellar brake protein YcgR